MFPLGTTTVTCRATDTQGNVGSASFTVRVIDTTPPQLTVPANMIVKPTALGHGGASNAPVFYSATATDIVSGNITPSCTPPPGPFPFATTTVTCVATDRAGNRSATKTFTVTVRAPGATDDSLPFKAPTVGAVQGTVALAVSKTPPAVPLGPDTTVFACDTSVTRITASSTSPAGGKPAPCVKSETTDGSHTYSIGELTPGSFNLFATVSSTAGDFTAGPIAVTITAAHITTRDITVAFPSNAAGVTGEVRVTNIPVGAKFAFTGVYGCEGPTTFAANGTPNDASSLRRTRALRQGQHHASPAPGGVEERSHHRRWHL